MTGRQSRFRRLTSWPGRTYRTRISAQLIGSSCLVVVLTILLLEIMIVAVLLISLEFRPENRDIVISEDLGRQAAMVAGEIAELPVSDTDRQELSAGLERFLQHGVPIRPGEAAIPLGDMPHIAILNERGDTIISIPGSWAAPDAPYTTIEPVPARNAAGRALELRGANTSFGNSYVLDYAGETMAAAQPIMIDGEFAGVVLVQADGVVGLHEPPAWLFLRRIGLGNLILFSLLTIPALAVAIPVGIHRARQISGRLERLSDTATAMARGDLSLRVDVEGEDEVAQLGHRFNAMVAQLEQADRSRRAFVANVSHELRTPVAILRGNLEQLLEHTDDQQSAERLEAMHRETVMLARLIDDLFTLARIEEAVFEIEPGPVDLDQCIHDAVDGIAPLAWAEQRVTVEAIVAPGTPPVLAELARVQQILNNLLYNALRHTPEGGVIVVTSEPAGDIVELAVTDTGWGIPEDELPHVFDRYYQVDQAGRHRDGSGLGLAIVEQLVEAMGGKVSVESVVGQGTSFRITLPVASSDNVR